MAEEGCAMVPKEKVYGWAIHFIDENIQDKEILVPKKVISKTVKVAAEANKKAVIVKKAIDKYESKELIRNVKGKKDKSVDGQVSIFDF
jgi:CxxC motif-containing protein